MKVKSESESEVAQSSLNLHDQDNHEGVITHLEPDMEKAMAPHSSTLAWKIPWTEEPGGLQSMGS